MTDSMLLVKDPSVELVKVRRAYYRMVDNPALEGQGMHSLTFEVEGPKGYAVFDVPNSEYTADNPALCAIAYCNERPSTTPEGLVGTSLPCRVRDGDYELAMDHIMKTGKRILSHASWFFAPPSPEVADVSDD